MYIGKKHSLFHKVFLAFILATMLMHLQGQNNVTSRIRVLRGANLSFIFNTFSRFDNGVTYSEFTELRLYFNDTIDGGAANPSGAGWQLTMRALQPNIEGDMSTATIPLATIRATIHYDGNDYGPFDLSTLETKILEDTDLVNVNKTIFISYDCGTQPATNLINKVPDTYVVDIDFTLKPL